jgi:hypothetical protein
MRCYRTRMNIPLNGVHWNPQAFKGSNKGIVAEQCSSNCMMCLGYTSLNAKTKYGMNNEVIQVT